MKNLKNIVFIGIMLIAILFGLPVSVNAASNPELQDEISKTVETALNDYLNNSDNLNGVLNSIIDEALNSSVENLTGDTLEEFENDIKESAKNALAIYFSDVKNIPDVKDTEGIQKHGK